MVKIKPHNGGIDLTRKVKIMFVATRGNHKAMVLLGEDTTRVRAEIRTRNIISIIVQIKDFRCSRLTKSLDNKIQSITVQGVPEITYQKENCISPSHYDQMS
jgi:hypothetical protein